MSWECNSCGGLNTDARTECMMCKTSKADSEKLPSIERPFSDSSLTLKDLRAKEQKAKDLIKQAEESKVNKVLTSTIQSIPKREIAESMGAVFGEVILGTNILQDVQASFNDLVGSRSSGYESSMKRARALAITDLQREALKLGADAVVGLSVDFENIGSRNMMMVCASGTAVKLA